jgi:tetratricopeptide (TPR) repeat protein
MTSGRQRVAWILLGALLVWPGWVWGQRVAADPIRFPTSGAADAQRSFLASVKLLHNFEYDDAISAFRDAIKTQPNFAMAYWGLAMSYNHPLWGEQDLDAARHVLADLDKISVSGLTPRERGFLDAVKKLYGPGDKLARDKAYAEAMHRLHVQFPDDDEAASFYGLALLGLRADTSDFLYTIEASDVLEKVYAHNPNHPGVLHYLVHCYDDPRYASLGLQAADRYEQVAADSAHALHMPAHIYLDLGMWKAFVHANEASWAASLDRLRREHLTPGQHDIHALHTLLWLEYGYLQQGKFAKAMDCLKTMARIEALSSSPMVEWYAAMMRAAYIVDAPDAHEMVLAPELKAINTLDLHEIELTAPASDAFADGLSADRQRQPQEVLQAREKIDAYIQHAQHLVQGHGGHQHSSFFSSTYASSIAPAHIMESQLEALGLLADGKDQDALDLLQQAVAEEDKLPVGYGPPVPVKPSAELLGEVYLREGDPQNAMRLFQLALLRYPNRAASLAGLQAAAHRSGDEATAAKATQTLQAIQGDGAHPYLAWEALPCANCAPRTGP